MVCTSITVAAPVGTITINSIGFAVDGVAMTNCNQPATTAGKPIQFMVNFTVSGFAESFTLFVGWVNPNGATSQANYTYTNKAVGTYNELLGTGSVYAAGNYSSLAASIGNQNP